jgi:hypothetical protein
MHSHWRKGPAPDRSHEKYVAPDGRKRRDELVADAIWPVQTAQAPLGLEPTDTGSTNNTTKGDERGSKVEQVVRRRNERISQWMETAMPLVVT